jgi:hypothetical protein
MGQTQSGVAGDGSLAIQYLGDASGWPTRPAARMSRSNWRRSLDSPNSMAPSVSHRLKKPQGPRSPKAKRCTLSHSRKVPRPEA